MFCHMFAETRALQRFDHSDRLHQRFAGAAGFGDGDEARRLQRQALQKCFEGDGIEIVEEVHVRLLAQRPEPGHRVIGELRQSLAAEARSAGAEENDVAGLGEFFHRLAKQWKIVDLLRQAQERQRAAAMRLAKVLQFALGMREQPGEGLIVDAPFADPALERAFDRMRVRHYSLKLARPCAPRARGRWPRASPPMTRRSPRGLTRR